MQTRKAAYSVIHKQKEIAEEFFHSGQIDDKEFEKINKHIIDSLTLLNNYESKWTIPTIKEFLEDI